MNQSGLYCPKCGQLNEAESRFCRYCGAPQPQVTPLPPAGASPQAASALRPDVAWQPPAPPVPVPPPAAAFEDGSAPAPQYLPPPRYAGFWIRVVAIFIDGVVIGIPAWLVIFVAALGMGAGLAGRRAANPTQVLAVMLPALGLMWLLVVVGAWLYEALMTSSSKQGTLGKMALGLKVTDRDGRRISFGRASGRHFAKIINGFTFGIGWLIAGFTARKQGLHDFIAGTCVIRDNR